MKKQWKEWFISNLYPIEGINIADDRKYSFTNIKPELVPFHAELRNYIFSLSELTLNTTYYTYHIHQWEEGEFFKEHADYNMHRKWAYVCELQPSECNTSLLVEGTPTKEGIFDSNTLHEVPKIQKGTRISLTVFGSPIKTPL